MAMRTPVLPTRLALSTMLIGAFALAGCGSTPADEPLTSSGASASTESTAPSAQASAEATPGTALSACELVTPADIESALGLDAGAVAEGTLTQSPTVLDAAVNECRYDDQDWGGLVVNVTPADGVNVFDALSSAYGDTAEAVSVGDGGFWFENNDRGYFLKGSVMAFLQFTFIADGTPFREPTITLGEALVERI